MTVVARQTGGPATHRVPDDARLGFVRCLDDCGHPARWLTDEDLEQRHKLTCAGCSGPVRIFHAQPESVERRYGLEHLPE